MPDAFEIALTEKITRMCVAKEGATTYYVDGTSGNDGANGLTWESAKKTIQAAVDTADSWADIYIKGGTYVESLTIATTQRDISLIGESRSSTTVSYGATGNMYVHGDNCQLHDLKLLAGLNQTTLNGDNIMVKTCYMHEGSIYVKGDKSIVDECFVYCSVVIYGEKNIVSNCFGGDIVGHAQHGIRLYESDAKYNVIFGNEFHGSAYWGVDIGHWPISTNPSYNTVCHNNIYDPILYFIADDGTSNDLFENYYNTHSNIDNGSGIATLPYSAAGTAGNSDSRPVIVRNGWLAAALSGVNGNAVADLTGRTISGDTGLIAHGSETDCSAVIGQSGKRAILQGGVVRGIQDGLAAGKKLTLRVYKYNGTGWDKVDDYDVTKDSGLEANIGHAAHDDYMKIAVLHDDATGTKTFYYKSIIQDMEE